MTTEVECCGNMPEHLEEFLRPILKKNEYTVQLCCYTFRHFTAATLAYSPRYPLHLQDSFEREMEEEFHALRMSGLDPMMVVSWAEDARRTGGFECEVTWMPGLDA